MSEKMTLSDLLNKIDSIAKEEGITLAVVHGLDAATSMNFGKKPAMQVDPPRPRVYVEIRKDMHLGKFEMTLKDGHVFSGDPRLKPHMVLKNPVTGSRIGGTPASKVSRGRSYKDNTWILVDEDDET